MLQDSNKLFVLPKLYNPWSSTSPNAFFALFGLSFLHPNLWFHSQQSDTTLQCPHPAPQIITGLTEFNYCLNSLSSVVFQVTLLLLGSTSFEQTLSKTSHNQTQSPDHLSNVHWQLQCDIKSTLLGSKPPSQPSPPLTDTFPRVAAWQQGSWLCWKAQKPGLFVLDSTVTNLGGGCVEHALPRRREQFPETSTSVLSKPFQKLGLASLALSYTIFKRNGSVPAHYPS